MRNTDIAILSLYKGDPNIIYSTEDIVQKLYPEEYTSLQVIFDDSLTSKTALKEAKAQLATLHRRVLHHMSRLVKEQTLRVDHIEGRGKKFYTLVLEEGDELIIDKQRKKLIITKPSKPALPLENLQKKQIVHLFENDTFFDRCNAVILESSKFDSIEAICETAQALFTQINDVIGFNDFEKLIQNEASENIAKILEHLGLEAKTYDKQICCIIDFTNIHDKKKIIGFFRELTRHEVTFVFDVTGREMITHSDILEVLIEMYAKHKKKLNIKNDDVHAAPYLIGKAGPYTVSPKDWEQYVKEYAKSARGFVCTQSAIIIDIEKCDTAQEFKKTVEKSTQALFSTNTYQRKFAAEFAKKLNTDDNFQAFHFSKNHIRLWNFEQENTHAFLDTIDEILIEIKQFAANQETIYHSCGMPTSFKIAFSLAYRQAQKLQPLFKPITISGVKDLYNSKIKDKLLIFERLAHICEGGMETRFYRNGIIDPLDIIREINVIFNSFKLPLFCYNFSERIGANMSLESFI